MSADAGWFPWGESEAGEMGLGGADIQELSKALAAGDDINNPGTAAGEGFPLRVESLDATMRSLVHTDADLVGMKLMPKLKADQVIQEFNQLVSVGADGNTFISEGDLPAEDDTTYARRYCRMKLMGVTKRITHLMSVIKNVPLPEGVQAAASKAGTLKMLRDHERYLWTADSTLSSLQFDGFEAMFIRDVAGLTLGTANNRGTAAWFGNLDVAITAGLAQDLRYQAMSQESVIDLSKTVRKDPNYGHVTDIFYGMDTHVDFSKQFLPTMRGEGLIYKGTAGVVIDKYACPTGPIDLNPATFIQESDVAGAANGPVAKRPAAPVVGAPAAAAIVAGVDPGTGFGASVQGRTAPAAVDGAGNYTYRAVAHNRSGRSAAADSAAVAVVVDNKVTFTVTDGSPAGVTEWYDIYRTFPGGAAATAKYIFSAVRTAAVLTVVDFNHFLPGTSKAYFIQRTLQAIGYYSLLPMMKLPLAVLDTSVRFSLLSYGAPCLFAPRKHGMAFNIAPLT